MSQRGFGIIAYLIAGGVLVAALGGLYWGIERHGYQRGMAAKQAQWDRANVKAQAEQDERVKAVSQALAEADLKRQAAQDKASDYNAKWQEARRELIRKGAALAVCGTKSRGLSPVERDAGVVVPERPEAAETAAGAADPAGSGIRFTWDFVRLYDGAWTDQAGEPVFPPAAGFTEPAGASAASPYGPGEVLEVHAENAQRCSADRRELGALMDKIKKAEKAWDEANKP